MINLKWIKSLKFSDCRQVYAAIALKQPRFTYSAYGPFTKHRERIQKFRKTGNLKHLYKNKSDKACFVKI